MIKYTVGNIIRCETEAIVNTVNTVGVMGKGIALAFKKAFPLNYRLYVEACKTNKIDIGKLLVTETNELYPKYIINFPTKKHWRYPSKYEYIESGLKDLKKIIQEYSIQSISIPPLGSGNGRLDWKKVKTLIKNYLEEIADDVEILIFEPGYQDQTRLEKKQVGLTDKRALFLYTLWKYRVLGYQTNLLVAQKIAYFIQKFGEDLNLKFEKGIYGPYAHNLTHLLKHINHSYIKFDEKQTSPAEELNLIESTISEIDNYYNNKLSDLQQKRVSRMLEFIEGFESPYGLELLATISFIKDHTWKDNFEDIHSEIEHWTERKKEIMKPRHIEVAISRLKEYDLF